jgi:Domain of unknown function (DUF4129)
MAQDKEGLETKSRGFALSGAGSMAAALALLALVALASTAQLDSGEALSSSELAVVLVLLGIVAVLVVAVGAVAFGSGYVIFGDSRRKLIAALLITALLAVLIALLLAPVDAPLDGGAGSSERPSTETRGEDYFRVDDNAYAAIAGAVIAGVALLAAALVVLGAKGLAERRRGASAEPEDEDEAMLQAVEESLDDLRRERDVRRAIIACYARMERALERAGSARRPAEAPFEYLVRVLERITANGRAARILTELFERAEFSVEPMGERDKQEAIGALELLRAELSQPL